MSARAKSISVVGWSPAAPTVALGLLVAGLAPPVVAGDEGVLPGAPSLIGEILDTDSGKTLGARLTLRGADGSWHAVSSVDAGGRALVYPAGGWRGGSKRVAGDLFTTLSAHPFGAELPPGTYTLEVAGGRGFAPARRRVEVRSGGGPARVHLFLLRWGDPAARGWFAVDEEGQLSEGSGGVAGVDLLRAEDLHLALLGDGYGLGPGAGVGGGAEELNGGVAPDTGPPGEARVYVRLSGDTGARAWLEGLDAGRTQVTTGPLLLVTLDGHPPGHIFRPPDARPVAYRLEGEALGERVPHRIEVIVDGVVTQTIERTPLPGDIDRPGSGVRFALDLTLDRSDWMAVRCWEKRPGGRPRYAYTSPFHIEVPRPPDRPRRAVGDPGSLARRVERVLSEGDGRRPAAAVEDCRRALSAYRDLRAGLTRHEPSLESDEEL